MEDDCQKVVDSFLRHLYPDQIQQYRTKSFTKAYPLQPPSCRQSFTGFLLFSNSDRFSIEEVLNKVLICKMRLLILAIIRFAIK